MRLPTIRRPAISAVAATVVAGLLVTTPPALAAGPVTGAHVATAAPVAALASGTSETISETTSETTDPSTAVDPTIRRHAIAAAKPAAAAKRTASGAAAGPTVLVTPAWAVTGLGMVGITWDAGANITGTQLTVRTRDGGTWSGWEPVEVDAGHGADSDGTDAHGADSHDVSDEAAGRPGTAPLLVGDVESVQVRVVSRGSIPAGLRLDVIDPGSSPLDAAIPPTSTPTSTPTSAPASPAAGAASPAGATAAATAVARPEIYTRAQWGADERLRGGSPSYGSVQTTFVHHTVNANDYSADEVPAIIRSIYAYHTQSRGWSDIGYNVLVDRFGRLWQGRYGDLERNVIGAHTLNWNEEAFGVSAIGNFEDVQPTTAMLDALASVLAWKLDMADLPATGSARIQGTTVQMINGHRDVGATACPGRYLYAKLPTIREKAAKLIGGATPPPAVSLGLRRSIDADTRPDVVLAEGGALQTMLGDGGPGFVSGRGTRAKGGHYDVVTGVGDVNGDGHGDVVVRVRRSGGFEVRGTDGAGGIGQRIGKRRRKTNTRFAEATALVGVPDLTGDGREDLLVRLPSGETKVAAGRVGGFKRLRLLPVDFSDYTSVLGAGDLDADGNGDLLLIDAQGILWSARGLGDLAFDAPVRRFGGWNGRTNIVTGHDLTGDGRADILATDVADGRTWIRPATVSGGFGLPIGGWRSWRKLREVTVTTDATGDGFADAVIVTAKGRLRVMASRHGMWLRPGATTPGDWTGYRWLQLVGDWTGDGLGDLAGVEGDLLWIFPGNGAGTFGARIGGWPGWTTRGQLSAVDDWTGDGHPDLVSRSANGDVWLHPGRGTAGVAEPVLLRAANGTVSAVLPVGRWNADKRPDLVAVTPDGVLQLWRGRGSTKLRVPITLRSATSLRVYDRFVGVGDLTGDGRPDLLATRKITGTSFILPGRAKGVGAPIRIAGGWRRYSLIG